LSDLFANISYKSTHAQKIKQFLVVVHKDASTDVAVMSVWFGTNRYISLKLDVGV
jgi:hypothetical protein